MTSVEWQKKSSPEGLIVANMYVIYDNGESICRVYLHNDLTGLSVSSNDKNNNYEFFKIRVRKIKNRKLSVVEDRTGDTVFFQNYIEAAKSLPDFVQQIFGGCYGVGNMEKSEEVS